MSQSQLRTARKVLAGGGTGVYSGQLNATNPDDVYKIRLEQRSSIEALLSGIKTNVDVALLDRTGKTLTRSARKGRSNETLRTELDTGTYFVKVLNRQGTTRYRLNLSVTASANTQASTLVENQGRSLIDQVLDLTNRYRQEAGLDLLRNNPKLATSAQLHSQDMAENDFFGHTSSNGATVFDRVKTVGYSYFKAAENIAVGYASPESLVQAWMNSPAHRDNILNPTLEEVGIGFFFLDNDTGNATYRYYWTQDFGTPL